MSFLVLLGAASQRIEILALELFGTEWVQDMVKEWKRKERGAFFGIAECGVIIYVIGNFKNDYNNKKYNFVII